MTGRIRTYLSENTAAAPLATFRIFFGLMMFASIIRFWGNGWIKKLYIDPQFFFSYYGFEFVKPLGYLTYGLFALCGISALMVAVGYKYRLAIVTFFFSFTYIELMDKTTYLNHYYFISIMSFLLIFLPANSYFSVDAKKRQSLAFEYVPRWSIDAIKLLICVVYFYAGLAKLNSDWLVAALPLKIWLPSKYDLPLLGAMLHKTSVIYFFSWGGALYDLAIPFLLLYKKTRSIAFILVIFFHAITAMLFPIGMFPYIMIVSATVFFGPKFHHIILSRVGAFSGISIQWFDNGKQPKASFESNRLRLALLCAFFAFQLAFPFRHLAYPGELFWTEQGYRFSWRVMLMEKAGYANFKIVDGVTQQQFEVNNSDFLTAFQEKQMSTQPDFMVQYAHFLKNHYEHEGFRQVEVYVESYVGLNGRRSQAYVDPNINLVAVTDSFENKTWVLPFNDEIKGL